VRIHLSRALPLGAGWGAGLAGPDA
jgi:hypothetical protein